MGACCSGKESKADNKNEEIYIKNSRNAMIADFKNSSEPKIEFDVERNSLNENITKLITDFSSSEDINIKCHNGITIEKISLDLLWNVEKFYMDDYTTSEYVLYDLREKNKKIENFLKKIKCVSYSYEEMKIMNEDRINKFRKFLENKVLIIILPDDNVSMLQDVISFFIDKLFSVKIHIMDTNMAEEGMNKHNQLLYSLMDQKYFSKLPYILLSLKFFPHLKSENMIFFDWIGENKNKFKFTQDILCETKPTEENKPFIQFCSFFRISVIFKISVEGTNSNSGNLPLEDKIIEFKIKKLEKNDSGKNTNLIDGQGSSMTCKVISLYNFFSYAAFVERKETLESFIDVLRYEIKSNNSVFIQVDETLDDDVLIYFLFLLIWKITDVDPEKIRKYIGEKFNYINNFKNHCSKNFEKVEELLRLYGFARGKRNMNSKYLNVRANVISNEEDKKFRDKLEYHLKELRLEISDQTTFEQIIAMIEQIVMNIIDNPKIERFYFIKKKSKAFEKCICVNPHSRAIFELFGFRTISKADGDEYYSLSLATDLTYFKGLYLDFVNSVKRLTAKN